jgi:hypothetical protein
MKRTYQINYHLNEYSDRINRCWGNSLHVLIEAINVVKAIEKFHKQRPVGEFEIYNIAAYHPTVELNYDATQALLKFEGFIVERNEISRLD